MPTRFTITLLFVFALSALRGQDSTRNFSISGRLSLTHDFYHFNSEGSAIQNPRRPTNLSRLVFTPTFNWGTFSLPVTLVLSSSGTNTVTPPGQFGQAYALFNQIKSFDDLVKYVQNPINQVGIAPKFGDKLQLFLGTHTPQYSQLTQGNISIFGGGFHWQPGSFFMSGNYGIAQHAITPDTLRNIAGAFKRHQYSARFGWGKKNTSYLSFNFTGGFDDTSSLSFRPDNITPESGLNGSVDFALKLGSKLRWGGEVATSLFTANAYSSKPEQLVDQLSYIPDFIPYNLSSRLDGAASTFVNYKAKNWGLGADVLYVGQGYKTFGFPFFQSDRFEYTLNPSFSLFQRKVNFTGRFGSRINNLSETKGARMEQLLVSANLNAQLTPSLNVNASYSNFGVQSSMANDTLRVENIAQNIAITPSYTLERKKLMHVSTLIFSYDDFEDLNLVSGALNSNQSLLYGLTYNMLLKNSPFTAGVNLMRFQLNSTQIQINNNTLGLTLGYKFFKKRLNTTAGLTHLINRPGADETNDRQWLMRFRLDLKLPAKWSLSALVSNNAYDYGTIRQGARLTETMLRLGLNKRF